MLHSPEIRKSGARKKRMIVSLADTLHIARLAPLSIRHVEELIKGRRWAHLSGQIGRRSQLSATQEEWAILEQEARPLRELLYRVMSPIIRRQLWSELWLRYALAIVRENRFAPLMVTADLFQRLNRVALTHQTIGRGSMPIDPLPLSTYKDWRQANLIPYSENQPAVHAATALLLAVGLDRRQKGPLPEGMTQEEWIWYALRLDSPEAQEIPVPISHYQAFPTSLLRSPSISEDVSAPPHSAYFSWWAGLSWTREMLHMNARLAMSWDGGVLDEEDLVMRWQASPDGLARWDKDAMMLQELDEDILNTIAELALKRLAWRRFLDPVL